MQKAIGIPRFGKYTEIIEDTFREAGFNVISAPPVTKRTIELGVKYGPSEVCFPLKSTLGTEIQLLEKGCDVLVMISTGGWCVLRCYWVVQKQILEDLGYKFEMLILNPYRPVYIWKQLKKFSPRLTVFKAIKVLIRGFKKVKELDREQNQINKHSPIRIAVMGEIYVCNSEAVNMDLIKKLQSLGCYVDMWINLWGNIQIFFKRFLKIYDIEMRKYKKLAKKYFPELAGGHANRNLEEALKYADEGYDGIICLKPLFCNPEAIIEMVLDKVSRDYDIPILQYSLDEFTQKTHFYNRIEAFIEGIKLKKGLK